MDRPPVIDSTDADRAPRPGQKMSEQPSKPTWLVICGWISFAVIVYWVVYWIGQ